MSARHVYDMGIVGNCAFMAHIDARAEVRWLCWPRFDSPFLFGSLLDKDRGGGFSIAPVDEQATSRQTYLANSNVLVTEFTARDGRFRVIDFAPRFAQHDRRYKPLMLMRRVERLDGSPQIRVRCRPAWQGDGEAPEPLLGSNHIRFPGYAAPVRLTTSVPLTWVLQERPFTLTEDVSLALTWGVPLEAPLEATLRRFLESTVRYWREWVERCTVPAYAAEAVIRSALALKLHQFEDTGALIAAATTSLPEAPGSQRLWDYRYCWLRDSYYLLSAFEHIGHVNEVKRYAGYARNLLSDPTLPVQPVYGIGGERALTERQLDLAGYRGHRPVRVGNQAHEHVQNDVYGQLLLSLLPLYTDARFTEGARLTSADLPAFLLDRIEATLDAPDAGLWELRGKAWKHTYTFLFHWAGAHAGERIAAALEDAALGDRARRLQSAAAERIERCYDDALGSYTHAEGSPHFDASLLQLITLGYLDPRGERAARLLDRVTERLVVRPGLLRRYDHEDDFGMPEVGFVLCGFWYAEALACAGRTAEAVAAFEALLACANPLGLLSEDAAFDDGGQWGNFPQTYSHVGVINAAFRIAAALDRPRFLPPPGR